MIRIKINDIRSLEEFKDLLMPVAEASHALTAALPKEPGFIRINPAPELVVAVTADEFMQLLPKEYVTRTRTANEILYSRRKVAIGKTVPRELVIDTFRKMKILILGSK